jgi:PAS domain S-box-containing protein
VPQWWPGYALALEFVDLLAKTFWAKVQYLSDLSSATNLNLTPFTFVLSTFVPPWNILPFQSLDIKRAPPRDVINGLSIGMVVLDKQDCIIDLNPAAQQIIGSGAANAIGRPIERVLVDHAELIERYRHVTEARTQITLGDGETQRYYDFHISSLTNHQGRLVGRVIALYDITARK